MNTTTTHYSEVIDVLAEAGFSPLDVLAEPSLTARQARVLKYFEQRGWAAYRLEDDTSVDGWATLALFLDDEVKLMTINANGVTDTEARFSLTPRGLAWLDAAVTA
jgi:hypothetical protein